MIDAVMIGEQGRRLADLAAAAEAEARYEDAARTYADAIAGLEAGVSRFPAEAGLRDQLIDVLQRAARLCWLLGEFDRQTQYLERALALAKRVDVLLDLAGSARDLGRYQQALSFADEALRLCDERGDAPEAAHLAERTRLLILRAEALQALGDGGAELAAAADRACQAARQEMTAHGESPWRLRRLAQALRLALVLDEYVLVSERAMALARERLTEAGADPASGPALDLVWMTLQYAEALRLTDELDTALVMARRAIIMCDRALAQAPAQLNFPYMKGLALKTAGGALAGLGDPLGAEESYRAAADAFGQVLARVPRSLDELKERHGAWQALGDLLARQKRQAEAADCYRLALRDGETLRAIAPGLGI